MFGFVWDFTTNQINEQIDIREIESSAIHASDVLVRTPGYPSNWKHNDFISIGLAESENIINHSKVLELNQTDYDSLRTVLGLSDYEFYIRILDLDSNIIFEFGNQSDSSSFVIPVRRYCIYDNGTRRLAYFDLVVWK